MNAGKVIVYISAFVFALLVGHLFSGAQTKFKKKTELRKIGVKPCNYNQYIELQKKANNAKEEHLKQTELLHKLKLEHEKYLRLQKSYTEHMKEHKTHTHENENEKNPELLKLKELVQMTYKQNVTRKLLRNVH